MSIREAEEVCKVDKLRREKPYAYEKMQLFDEMTALGKSIAIIRIEYSYACNFRCTHCCIDGFRDRQRKLTPMDVRRIATEADALGLARFVLTGGEPLVFPDIREVIKAMQPEKFYINLDTNGWFLTKNIAYWLKHVGVDRIQLSIDSLNAYEHDAFRCKPGSHERAMEAADNSLEAGLDLFIQTVCTKQRLYSPEFKQFMRYFNDRGIGVFITYIKPVGAYEGKTEGMVSREDIAYVRDVYGKEYNVFDHLTPAYGRDVGCIAVKGMVSVQPWGDVRPCPYWPRVIGNVFDDSLDTILTRAMKQEPFNRYIDTCPVADCGWEGRL